PPEGSHQNYPLGVQQEAYRLQEFLEACSLRKRRRKSHHGSDGRHKVDRLNRTVEHLARANPCTQGHHPSSPRGSVAGAMMLKSVPARIIVRVAPKVRKNE